MDEQAADERRERIVDAKLALAKARFGDRFDQAQWDAIRENILGMTKCGDALRAVPLGNSDEPEIVFVPYRADDPAWGGR
ncbi:MAG: hypothetical protein ACJ789_01605 [Thermomicrobiales bacterium]